MEVRARASCRADLAGGTLDIWPLGVLHRGACTINAALELSVWVTLCPQPSTADGYRIVQLDEVHSAATIDGLLEDRDTALVGLVLEALAVPPVAIEIESQSPRGGGLGASSALTVALIAAAEALAAVEDRGADARTRDERAWLARDLEARLMGLPTGCQDHYPALYGGVLELSYLPGGTRVRALNVDLERLSKSLVIAYSGASHVSAENNWSVVRSRLEGDATLRRLLDGIVGVAGRMAAALDAGDLATAGQALTEEWALRRQLSEVVSIPILEDLLIAARDAGAWGGKACGAGGGGCVVILTPPDRREAVEAALEDRSGQILSSGCAARGLDVTVTPSAR